jgi:hypothetical protein
MMRRILTTGLALTLVAATLPTAAFAEESTQSANQAAHVSALPPATPVLNLQNATRGVAIQKSALQASGPFLKTPKGKAALAVGIIAVALVVGYQVSKGPDPTPATAR